MNEYDIILSKDEANRLYSIGEVTVSSTGSSRGVRHTFNIILGEK